MLHKNDKIYIAGHNGMVGSAVLGLLAKRGYSNIICRDRAELNLLDQQSVKVFFEAEKPDYVFLAAARVGGIMANKTYQADFLYENLQIQNNVIWQAHINNVKKLLFFGSSCIYPHECQQPMKEGYLLDGKPEPTNEGYAIAKIAGIKLCEKIYEQYGQKFISCMPTNLYGPSDNFNLESSHVLPALIRKFHEAKVSGSPEVTIWGSGEARRDFLHVDDLAEAALLLMKTYEDNTFVNIGTGTELTIKELANKIKATVGYSGNIVFDNSKPNGMLSKLLDVNKMHDLGWNHAIELDDGLRATYGWLVRNFAAGKIRV